jgi:hypothetical protein
MHKRTLALGYDSLVLYVFDSVYYQWSIYIFEKIEYEIPFPNSILFLALSLTLSSCFQSKDKANSQTNVSEFRTIAVADQYSLDVPASMVKTTKLNEDASLQYQNIFKET